MKILYLTYHFAPYNCIAAVRANKQCKYLLKLGHDVQVIAGANQLLPDDLELEIPRERVTYIEWKNINKVFEKVSGGHEKVANRRSYLSESQKKNKFIRLATHLYKSILYFPDDKIGWIKPVLNQTGSLINTWQPDVVFVSGGPHSSFIIGRLLSNRYNIPWVAELRDLWTQNHDYKFGPLRKLIERGLERWSLKTASHLITVSDHLAKQLKGRFDQPVSVITNSFDPDERQATTQNNFPSFKEDALNIVYTGQLYVNKQNITPLLEALWHNETLRDFVRIHMFGPNIKEKLENKFSEDAIEMLGECLIFHGLVSHEEALYRQKSADILLFLGWSDEQQGGVLTGKLFEYLGARRPILSINDFEDDATKIIEDASAGRLFQNEMEIKEWLIELWDKKQSKGEIKNPEAQRVEQYSTPYQTSKLSEVLEA